MLSVYGFGRGEIALSIKQITEFLEADYMMNFVGMTFFVTVIVNAIILSKVVIEYYRRMFLMEESRKQEERLRQLEVEAVEARYLKEIKYLVHDLKTPLVSIQGLSGVIKLRVTDAKVSDYTDRISSSAEKMSLMISEILYEDAMREMTVSELFNFISAQLSPEELGARVRFELDDPDVIIYANKIRLSRALINLIDNGLTAVVAETGWVRVQVYGEVSRVTLVIKDNGIGIPETELAAIWKIGYTTGRGHTGLGLNFVKHVIEEHGGTITLVSVIGEGTTVTISLPEVELDNESNSSCG
jgi:signal transduction histidine kinase